MDYIRSGTRTGSVVTTSSTRVQSFSPSLYQNSTPVTVLCLYGFLSLQSLSKDLLYYGFTPEVPSDTNLLDVSTFTSSTFRSDT